MSYLCPIDAKSAVYEFSADMNGRKIIAHCVEKQKAQEIYKTAVEQGLPSIIASESNESSDVFSLSLGNLFEGEKAVIHLEMVSELQMGVQGSVRFDFPTVFNPRYSSNFSHFSKPSSNDSYFYE